MWLTGRLRNFLRSRVGLCQHHVRVLHGHFFTKMDALRSSKVPRWIRWLSVNTQCFACFVCLCLAHVELGIGVGPRIPVGLSQRVTPTVRSRGMRKHDLGRRQVPGPLRRRRNSLSEVSTSASKTATGCLEVLLCVLIQRPAEALCTATSFAGSLAHLTDQDSAGEGISRPQTASVPGRQCQSQ